MFRSLTLSLLLIASFISHAQYTFNKVDIWPGTSAGMPIHLATCNNMLFFMARDSANGYEPWVSDGSVSGTRMVKNIAGGAGGSNPMGFTEYNGKTYFQANDGVNGMELWVTDGTAAGTQMVADINPGSLSSDPQDFIVAGGLLYFRAREAATGSELWVTDGTAAGTHITKDLAPGTANSFTSLLIAVEYNGKLYFNGRNTSSGTPELYVSDGTAAGTNKVDPSTTVGIRSDHMIVYNGYIYFSGTDGGSIQDELYVSDGTAVGTHLFKDLSGSWPSKPENFIVMNGNLYFTAETGYDINGLMYHGELWVSDGTVAGTQLVKDIWPGHHGSTDVPFTIVNNKLFFSASDSAHGAELWASDGTAGGTYMVKDITKGGAASVTSFAPLSCASFANKYFFNASIDSTPKSVGYLWVSDGTDTGTRVIRPSWATNSWRPIYNPGGPAPFVVIGNKMFFTANFDGNGVELYWIGDTVKLAPPPISVAKLNTTATFNIAPNPSNGIVVITLDKVYVKARLTVTDITGRKVNQQPVGEKDKNVVLNLSNVPKGSYIVTLTHGNGTESQKLLLE